MNALERSTQRTKEFISEWWLVGILAVAAAASQLAKEDRKGNHQDNLPDAHPTFIIPEKISTPTSIPKP